MESGMSDNWCEIETGVIHLIRLLSGRLPERDLVFAASLAHSGEWDIAVEHVVTQLYDYNVVVPSDVLEKISHLNNAMNLDAGQWDIVHVEGRPSPNVPD